MLDTLVRIAISPLLITQALRVRRMAQSLPEAAGARQGNTGSGLKLRLQIIGDSSGAGVGVATQKEALAGQLASALAVEFSVDWQLDAVTGATTRSTLTRLENARARQTDIVVVALGVNDVTRLIPRKRWFMQQRLLFDRINTLYAPKRIYVSGMPPLEEFPLLPNPLRWTLGRHAKRLETALLTRIKAAPEVCYLPFALEPQIDLMASDGFHPSGVLYKIWADELANQIMSDWPSLPEGPISKSS